MTLTRSLDRRAALGLLVGALCVTACTGPNRPDDIDVVWSDDDSEILVIQRNSSHEERYTAYWFDIDVHDVATGAVTRLRDHSSGAFHEAFDMRDAGYLLVRSVRADHNDVWRIAPDGSETRARLDRYASVLPSPDGSVIASIERVCWAAEGCDATLRLLSGDDLSEQRAIAVHLDATFWDMEWEADGAALVLVPRAVSAGGVIEDAVAGDTIRVALDGTVTEPGPVPACEAREAGTTSGPRAEDGRYVITTWDPEADVVSIEIRGGSSDRAFPGLCL